MTKDKAYTIAFICLFGPIILMIIAGWVYLPILVFTNVSDVVGKIFLITLWALFSTGTGFMLWAVLFGKNN